jgi:hypothetical protein
MAQDQSQHREAMNDLESNQRGFHEGTMVFCFQDIDCFAKAWAF